MEFSYWRKVRAMRIYGVQQILLWMFSAEDTSLMVEEDRFMLGKNASRKTFFLHLCKFSLWFVVAVMAALVLANMC